MGPGAWVILAIAFVIVVGNVATVRLIWASSAFAASQKMAQTALVWVLPGSFLFVRYVLREAPGQTPRDPTARSASLLSSIGDFWFGTAGHRADDGRGPGGESGAGGADGGGEGGV